MSPGRIVIIGGGHAGAQLCGTLAAAGYGPRTHLVCLEPWLPYQRPPLSKGFQKRSDETLQLHRGESWYAEHGITVHLGCGARAIHRAARQVTLASGEVLAYDWLVLATGTRARQLPQLDPRLANVHVLRDADDALRLRSALVDAPSLTVLGGGFIGLEVAATALASGKSVTVFEAASRLMQRSVSPELSDHVLQVHRASGIDVRTGTSIDAFVCDGNRVAAVQVGAERHPVDQLLLGIGASPESTLAEKAGLACDDGVVVDEFMRTSDPAILAVGDCTNFPEPLSGRRRRLESVQNANDQAKVAAATILGAPQPYRAMPWFWSDQGTVRLQMAGLAPPDAERHRRPGSTSASFSILHYCDGRLVCVESVNASPDHIAARRLLEQGSSPAPALACDPGTPLKQFAN